MVKRILLSLFSVFLVISVASIVMACSSPSSADQETNEPELGWTLVDKGQDIYTACATDGIRVFVRPEYKAYGLTAVVDHTCDK